MDILPRARPVDIRSAAPPAAVLERLRQLVAGWRGSKLAAAAMPVEIYGWSIEERPGSLVVRPQVRMWGWPYVIFEGSVQGSGSGSSISGRIRLHPVVRAFLIAIAVIGAAVPLGMLLEAGDWHEHLIRAGKTLPISLIIVCGGFLIVRAGAYLYGRYVLALLSAAAGGG